MDQQQNQLLQQALQLIEQLQKQILPLHQEVQSQQQLIVGQQQQLLVSQQMVQEQQQSICELQLRDAKSRDNDNNTNNIDDDDGDDDPLVMSDPLEQACKHGNISKIITLLGKDVNSVNTEGWTPIMVALRRRNLQVVKLLVSRGADLGVVTSNGWNVLHFAARGGDRECIHWVLHNTSITVNSVDNGGDTPIIDALDYGRQQAAELLVEKGANLFLKSNGGRSAIEHELGPKLLQHAKDLVWGSVKPLLLLTKACSLAADDADALSPVLPSVAKVFGIFGMVELISSYIRRQDIIIRGDGNGDDQEPDEVKRRIEASLSAARLVDLRSPSPLSI
jgi:hypothetical protein